MNGGYLLFKTPTPFSRICGDRHSYYILQNLRRVMDASSIRKVNMKISPIVLIITACVIMVGSWTILKLQYQVYEKTAYTEGYTQALKDIRSSFKGSVPAEVEYKGKALLAGADATKLAL